MFIVFRHREGKKMFPNSKNELYSQHISTVSLFSFTSASWACCDSIHNCGFFFAFYSYLRCAIHLMSTQCSFAWSKSELKLKNKSVKWDKGKSTCKYLPLTVVHILTFNFDFESVFLFPPFLYGFSSQSLSLSLIYDQLFTVRCFPNCFWVNYHAQQMVFWPPIQVQ